MEWMEQARCREVDPEIFMPEGPPSTLDFVKRQALRICQRCEVMEDCRAYAYNLAREQPLFGVWGGMTAQEINKAVRRRRASA